MKTLPRPSRDCTVSVPPCACTIHCEIDEPEPESAALRLPRARAIGAPESIEDVRQIGRRDADARVAHRDDDLIAADDASPTARRARRAACT